MERMVRDDHKLAQALRKLRDWALTSEYYDQLDWAKRLGPTPDCGTTMCLAGKVVTDAGYRFVFGGVNPALPPNIAFSCSLPDEEKAESIADKAQEILGLTEDEARLLFNGEDVLGEISEGLALDFLNYLIERAENAQGPMSREAVDEWQAIWWEAEQED